MKTMFFRILAAALLGGLVMGCSNPKKERTSERISEPIVVHFGDQAYPEVILAQEKGFFEEELKQYNATVKILEFQSGPPQVEALAAKELDFASFGEQPAIQAIASGVSLKIVSGILDGALGFGLIARADSGIKVVKDIKGRKIAAPAGSSAYHLLTVMLEKSGLTFDDIEFVNLSIGSITPSLIAGHVEGAVAYGQVFTNPPVDEGIVQINSGFGYKRGLALIAGRTEFLEKYPDITVAVLRALQKAAKWRVDHYDETLDILSNFLGFDKIVIEMSIPTAVTLLKLDDAAKDEVLMSVDLLFRTEILSERFTAEQLFDDKYAVAAGLETYPGWGADKVNN